MSIKKMNTMRASHILLETLEEALEVLSEIESGRDFEQLARLNSCCPSKNRGGDLGFFTNGQMTREFEAAVLSLERGEISGPIWTEFGHHIIKRVE